MTAAEPIDVGRLRRALTSLEGKGQPLDAGRIFDALHGSVSAEEREAVVDQLLQDPDAAQAWRLANELAPPAAHGGGWAAPWRWMAVAAAVVLTVGFGWQVADRARQVPEPTYRGVESRAIASALPPGVVLARAQPVLRWTGLAGARYRVRVLTPELAVLEESAESAAQEVSLSAETLRRIPAGGQLLWQVEARVPDGGAIVSPTFTVRVD